MEPLTYLCNTTPSLSKLQRNLPLILPYVDRAVICIGQRDAQSEAYCKSFDKVKLVFFPWSDSFKDAYQTCFDHAPQEGWHLRLDDDEVPSNEMLMSLRPIIEKSENDRKANPDLDYVFAFNCLNVQDGVESKSNYHREMLYKWNSNLHYEVDLHQSLVGLRGPRIELPYLYRHYKTTHSMLRGAFRDFFTAGVWADREESFPYWYHATGQDPRLNPGGPLVPNPEGIPYPLRTGFLIDAWHDMWDILDKYHPNQVGTFKDLDLLIRQDKICDEFRKWAERHNEENDKRPHLHELYCVDKYLKLGSR